MSDGVTKSYTEYVLPPSIVSKVNIARLVNEVELLDNQLTTASVQAKAGSGAPTELQASQQLRDFLQLNTIAVTNDAQARGELLKQLRMLKEKAPVIHMTFSSEADQASLREIVSWLRQSIHPQALLNAGLQPSLVAGVYLRTPNRVHDLSLRATLKNSRSLLREELEALRGSS